MSPKALGTDRRAWLRAVCAFFTTSIVFAALAAPAQSSSLQESPFSSGLQPQQQQQQQQPQMDTTGQSNTGSPAGSSSLQVGSKVLTQQQQSDANGTTTERNGRPTNQNLPEPPFAMTGFQRLVAASIGKVLPIYGSTLFSNVPSTFAPVDRIPVTPEYVIGPGDELLIRMWGQVTLDGHFTVDRSGNVYIPQVGTVQVAGIPFAKLTDYLRSQIGRTFRNFDLNVNIGQLRSIQIFIVGEAKRPGSYTVSSLSTLVNALFASGGPAPMGSLRNIQVKRGGVTVSNFDFYDLLLHGDKSKDVPLMSGDVIYIPPVGPMVALAGSVGTPALYELKAESTLQDVLALAGGLSTLAQRQQVRVERIQNHDARSILDIRMDASGLATAMSDGDILEVSPIIDRFKDVVTLRGNVADPRRFTWFPGMRIRDIIPQKEALLTRDYWQKRNQLGLPVLDSTPDVRQYAPDAPVIQVNGHGVGPTRTAAQLGLPNAQGLYATPDSDTNVYGNNAPFGGAKQLTPNMGDLGDGSSSNMVTNLQNSSTNANNTNTQTDNNGSSIPQRAGTLSLQGQSSDQSGNSASSTSVSSAVTGAARRFPAKNAVILSAPEVDWAYSVIQRLDTKDLTSQLVPFNLGKVVLEGDNTENLELQPGDVVTVFSKADIRVPQSQQTKYVRLEGEFLSSGTYSVKPGETLRQLVARVGGLTSNAYLYGSQFTRESTRVLQQQRINDYASDLDRRIKLAEANSANNALNPQDQVADVAALQNARTVAVRLRQLNATGRIVLNVHSDSKTIADIPDLPLEDGDAFVVPQVPSNVDVFGSVYTQNSFIYNPHLRAGDYIRQAGGATRTADVKRSYIVRADGSIISRQYSSSLFTGNFDSTHLYPGDAVIVPEQVDRRPLLRNLVDIATIIGQFGLGIAAINVL